MNTGDRAVTSQNRLLTTIAYRVEGRISYALEGSIFIAGAAVKWLRDGLKIIANARESERLAQTLADNRGVYMVPAFTGLGAPYWNPEVRGALFGLTQATGPAEIARAALEAVCYQTHDLLAVMTEDGLPLTTLRIDGGMVANNWMAQFLADILDLPVDRPRIMETTALGAAYLAGLQAGIFGSFEDLHDRWRRDTRFEPQIAAPQRRALLAGWHDAVQRVLAEEVSR
jgi:glycerol kinase